jgi:hypothetical protein
MTKQHQMLIPIADDGFLCSAPHPQRRKQ